MKGPISWMARNSVAANLLMIVILVGGALGASRIKQEVFPAFDLDLVRVTVVYPGASPEEVEQGIVLAVEEVVRGVDGVKRVTSGSAEGAGAVRAELLIDADPDRVLADIKAQVGRIRSFPEDAEQPQIAIAGRKQRVISLVIAGDQRLQTLQEIAERARIEMLNRKGITLVEIEGVPAQEIAVEIRREKLEEYGLSLSEVAQQIRATSMELPGGSLKTNGGELLVRLSDRRENGDALQSMVIRSSASGGTVRLSDVAKVTDGYAESDEASFFNGERAVRLTAYRVGNETPQGVADSVLEYADILRAELPDNISLAVWDDESEMLRGRIDLLVRNARLGLILVLIVLALFLNLRLAFWVALGIPISFLGVFLLMPGFDMTINMVSLFALIIVLGMVVDDAIIIGEAGYAKILAGKGRLEGAIEGAREMASPVSFAILTTIAAFSPLLVIPGLFGKIFRIIPLMVIGVLIFSLIESFFILPAHLSHMGEDPKWLKPVVKMQTRVSQGLQSFINRSYRPTVRLAVEWRYSAVAGSVALLFLTLGLVISGIVPRSFFPALEGDVLSATVQFPYGSNVEEAEKAGRALQTSAEETLEKFGGDEFLRGMFLRVGSAPPQRGPGPDGMSSGSHVVSLEINLVPGEERDFTSAEFKDAWQSANQEFLGARSVVFTSAIGPSAGAAVALQLSHRSSDVLSAASAEITTSLSAYSDLTNIENGFVGGKRQLNFTLREEAARTLGLNSEAVARQIRASFFGAEALREQRGRNELRVMVRLPKSQRVSEYDIESLDIRTPSGSFVALGEVADFSRNRAPTTIDREDGRRVVTVTGALAPGVKSPTNVLEDVTGKLIPQLKAKYPELTVGLVGEQREQGEVFSSLGPNALLALFLIFSLLAVPLKSYIQPLIIMSAIPFGFVGAVWGHLVTGYQLSFVSALGIFALAGVVVNDSLVLVDTTNRYRRSGASAYDAITQGGARRFRPILLTSLTTFFGLLPMIFEQSVQAKFLIPMAVSLGFGVLFATFIILLLVPALYMITEDVRVLLGAEDERSPTPGGWEPQEL